MGLFAERIGVTEDECVDPAGAYNETEQMWVSTEGGASMHNYGTYYTRSGYTRYWQGTGRRGMEDGYYRYRTSYTTDYIQ